MINLLVKKNMNYEFICIIKPFLPEDVRIKLLDNLKKIFITNKGEIKKEDIWGKRHLAYKIKGHEEGYYLLYELKLDPGSVDNITKELNLLTDVLRYSIMKV